MLKKGAEVVELVQVAYEINNHDVEQRETKALAEASQELNVSNLTVLTWNDEREVEKDGKTIKFKPLWKWLLDQDEK